MRRLRLAPRLVFLLVLFPALFPDPGLRAQQIDEGEDRWLTFFGDKNHVFLRIEKDTIPVGRPVPAMVWIRAPLDQSLVLRSVTVQTEHLRLIPRDTLRDPLPARVAAGDSIRVGFLLEVPTGGPMQEFFGHAGQEVLGDHTHKLKALWQPVEGKERAELIDITVHATPFVPPTPEVLGFGIIGVLLGFLVKRLALRGTRSFFTHRSQDAAPAPAGQPAMDAGGRRLVRRAALAELGVDLVVMAILGGVVLARTVTQEPEHFTSLLAAFLLGFAVGGLGDDHLLRRAFGEREEA